MNKLFIIGNGFDLMHKIPSRYEDFRQYLVSVLEKLDGKSYQQYDFTDNSIITSDYIESPINDILTILYFLSVAELDLTYSKSPEASYDSDKQLMWKNIERSVGELNYDDFTWLYINESKDDKEYRANWINEDLFSPYIKVLTKIPAYFKEWICQININKVSKNQIIEKYFDSNSLFLSFNYTNTLEKVYNIAPKNICYIHGKAIGGNEIFFGHGNNFTYDDFINSITNLNYFSVADGYSMINDTLRKPVQDIIL